MGKQLQYAACRASIESGVIWIAYWAEYPLALWLAKTSKHGMLSMLLGWIVWKVLVEEKAKKHAE